MISLASSVRCQIITPKTPEEISERLGAVTERATASRSAKVPFAGNVSPYGFCITPVLPCNNSFLPFLTGTFSVAGGKTVISVTARLHPFTRLLIYFATGLCSIALLPGLFSVLAGDPEKMPAVLWPFGFMVITWIAIRCAFYAPAKKAIEDLRQLLK